MKVSLAILKNNTNMKETSLAIFKLEVILRFLATDGSDASLETMKFSGEYSIVCLLHFCHFITG